MSQDSGFWTLPQSLTIGSLIAGSIVALAVLAPAIAPYDPVRVDPGALLTSPGPAHWLGTDDIGRDLFSLQRLRGWGFDVEILYLARRRGYRVQQLGIDWYYDAESRVRGLSDSLSMLGEILRIRLHALLGFYRRRLPPTSDYRPSCSP